MWGRMASCPRVSRDIRAPISNRTIDCLYTIGGHDTYREDRRLGKLC